MCHLIMPCVLNRALISSALKASVESCVSVCHCAGTCGASFIWSDWQHAGIGYLLNQDCLIYNLLIDMFLNSEFCGVWMDR